MADIDVVTEETEKKGVVVPMIAGAAGLVGGAVGAAQFMGGEKLEKKIDVVDKKSANARRLQISALEEAKIELFAHPTEGQANRVLKDAYENTQNLASEAEDAYTVARKEGMAPLKTLSAEKQGKIAVARAEGQLAYLQSIEKNGMTEFVIQAQKAELDALKEATGKSDFAALTSPDDITKALKAAGKSAESKYHTLVVPKDYENLDPQEIEKAKHAGLLNAAKVEPEVMKPILEATQGPYDVMVTTATAAKNAEKAWITDKLNPLVKDENAAVKSASEEFTQLYNQREIIKETGGFTGALKRPWKILTEETGTKAKLAITASAVALAAIVYAGARALSGGKQKSFADDVTQQRAAGALAAAAPSV